MITTDSDRLAIAQSFITGLRTNNHGLLTSIMMSDVAWKLPGDSLISGEERGIKAVLERVSIIARKKLTFNLKHILLGHDGVALSLNNTAEHRGLVFDEHLVTVLTLDEGKVRAVATYFSDLEMLNAFFAAM